MGEDLWKLSAVKIVEGIRNHQFSCQEVVTSVNERISRLNPSLNAIVGETDKQVIEEAKLADQAFEKGSPIGVLHGVPVTIKSNIDVKGQPTSNGLRTFDNLIAKEDSPVVSNLKKEGAIIIGRTNIPELSMRITTDNPIHGRTLNPWDEQASPGGSSGGASSAAAAGFGPIHHGNDGGGSLRYPAFNCGLATLKPTFGRIPSCIPSAPVEHGILIQLMAVEGAICRNVEDLRLATRVMAAEDARDPFWMPVPFDEWPDAKNPIRIGITTESYGHPIHPEIKTSVEKAASYLSDAGYEMETIVTPSVSDAADCWFRYLGHELKNFLMPLAKEYGSKTIQQIFEWYFQMGNVSDIESYREGIKERTAMTREWNVFLEETPLILSPFYLQPTPDWDCDAKSFEGTRDAFFSAIYSTSINWLGLPSGVVPIGMVEGRPAGVQIIGRRFREDLILNAMQKIEDRVGILTEKLWQSY